MIGKVLSTSLGFLVITTTFAYAEGPTESRGTVSITVTGHATGVPDTMRITLSSSATAGTAGDALDQCQKKSAAAIAAIEALNLESLTVEPRMPQFSSPAASTSFGMLQAPATPAGTVSSQSIVVELGAIQGKSKSALSVMISQVLDAGNRVGVGIGQIDFRASVQGITNNPVEYVVADASDLRSKALEDAIQKIHARKKRLRESGVSIGELTSVRDSMDSKPDFNPWQQVMDASSKCGEENEASSPDPAKVTVSHRLTMVFEIQNKGH